MTTSPTKTKQKLSLRKRLFVKKSPKVGCYVDTDSNDEFSQSTSRPISPADPFIAQSVYNAETTGEHSDPQRNNSTEPMCNTSTHFNDDPKCDDENHQKCCKTFFKRSRPRSLVEGQSSKEDSKPSSPVFSTKVLSDQTNSITSREVISKATIKFPVNNEGRRSFEHSGSFDGIKNSKGKTFVKRLSADHLISNEIKPLCRSSSPEESDRSNSLDRKRRYVSMFSCLKLDPNCSVIRLFPAAGPSRRSLDPHHVPAAQTAWLATHCLLHKYYG